MTKRRRKLLSRALQLSLGGALAFTAVAQETGRMDKLEVENKELKARLDSLEALAKKEGLVPSGDAKPVTALSTVNISGFVQASYFYNLDSPNDKASDGYLWNTSHNSFSINKVKLTLASGAVAKDKWDAGYRASLIWGQDAAALNTGGELQGMEALREAFVEINAPIGTGLNIKVGQLISLLNYESGDGGAANNNFSQGFQWWYTGNGPSAGVQLGYTFTDWLDVKLRVQNGMYTGGPDANDAKTTIVSFGLKPMEDLWVNLIAFGGNENTGGLTTVKGASVLAGYQVAKPLSIGLEFDYFNFDAGPTDADLWSIGTFINYDISEQFSVALRAEYLADKDGGGFGFGVAGRAGSTFPAAPVTDPDGDLASVALTFNYKPVPSLRIQPEIRYDTTSYNGGFDGEDSRVIIGAGVSYLF